MWSAGESGGLVCVWVRIFWDFEGKKLKWMLTKKDDDNKRSLQLDLDLKFVVQKNLLLKIV